MVKEGYKKGSCAMNVPTHPAKVGFMVLGRIAEIVGLSQTKRKVHRSWQGVLVC